MTNSAEVAARAGVSRSTVSQILNGHEHRFTPDTVELVREAARGLGYRPSLAGRTLVRGTSDIVLTLIPDIAIGPGLRELLDVLTQDLAKEGLTNLIRMASGGETLQDAVLGLRPFGVVSLSPLVHDERERLTSQGVRVIEPNPQDHDAVESAMGRLQAEHLSAAGYDTILAASPTDERKQGTPPARSSGVLEWCRENGHPALPAIQVRMEPGGPADAVSRLPSGSVGI